mgnify:CR=1 FL=1
MTRFWPALLPLALTGCDTLTSLFEELARIYEEEPRFVYATQSGTPGALTTILTAASLDNTDRGLPFRVLNHSLPDGDILNLRMAPDARRVIVAFVETGAVTEALFEVLNLDTGASEAYHTDNTLSHDIETLCTSLPTLAEALGNWPQWIADGTVPPDTTPGLDFYDEDPNNEATVQGWTSATGFDVSVSLSVGLAEIAADGTRTPYGPSGTEIVALHLESDGSGGFAVTTCNAPPAPIVTGTPARTLTIGTTAPDTGLILLDGAPLLNHSDSHIDPGPVLRLTGPWRPD